jgi:hypothetical protein
MLRWWGLLFLAVVGTLAWLLGFGDVVRSSVAAGHLLDWVMGGLCFLWLILILKAPWDLYFQTHEVAFELQRSHERRVRVVAGREEYIRSLRRRLLWLSVGAHLFSAALVAVVAYLAHHSIGYYFAAFYLVSTVFRPAAAGYVYLSRKLHAIEEEARYPREDVVEIREKLEQHEHQMDDLTRQMGRLREELQSEQRQLRQSVNALSHEFETTASSLTDNQEVIKGIQALARMVAQSTHAE